MLERVFTENLVQRLPDAVIFTESGAISAPPGTVLAVIRPGYGSAQNILRPAGVVVSRGPAAADPD